MIFRASLCTIDYQMNFCGNSQSDTPYLVFPDLLRSHIINSPFRALVRILLLKTGFVIRIGRDALRNVHTAITPCHISAYTVDL